MYTFLFSSVMHLQVVCDFPSYKMGNLKNLNFGPKSYVPIFEKKNFAVFCFYSTVSCEQSLAQFIFFRYIHVSSFK